MSAMAVNSRAEPLLTIMPFLEHFAIPETKAMGAANNSGQGEATTNTWVRRWTLPDIIQLVTAMTREIIVKATA